VTSTKLALLLLLPIAALAACTNFGPKTIPRDRFEYSASIADSWKRQTLLNVVKLRYLDLPTFVDVGQIVSGYSIATTLGAGATIAGEELVPPGNTLNVSGATRFEDRPTITYTPLTGSRFVRSLMTPLPPDAVFFTIQSGWAADGILAVAASSINGLRNQSVSASGMTPPDPEFLRVLQILRELQLSGAVGMRIVRGTEGKQASILTLRTERVLPEVRERCVELRKLLHLDPDAQELELVYGSIAANDKEVAVLTNSILHVLMTMSTYVEVPANDVSEGRATPGWAEEGTDVGRRRIRILCSEARPQDAFTSVEYRGHWYWIDDRDLVSKRALAVVMLLFTLSDSGERENLPLITIPAQ
jgi:hypothetical protein